MDAQTWNERYGGTDLYWPREPNRWVVQETETLAPGRALDLGAGEGRNAIWLADRGWHVDAVDFASEAIERGRGLEAEAERQPGVDLDITWVVEDVRGHEMPASAYDLVLLSYVHLEAYDRRELVRSCANAVAPGGTLLVVGHDTTNLTEGIGGPRDEGVLFTGADLEDDLQDHLGSGALALERSGRVAREVDPKEAGGEPAVAWDALFRATRRDMSKGGFSF